MREILFRGKTKENGEWVQGYFVYAKSDFDSEELREADIIPHNTDRVYKGEYNVVFPCIPESIGQYTGLTDKNGNKIFEGDVFVDNGNETIDVVEFRNGKFCLVSYGIKGALMEYGWDENAGGFGECECCAIDDYYVDEIEFTHNIHDNPELLRTPQNDEVRE